MGLFTVVVQELRQTLCKKNELRNEEIVSVINYMSTIMSDVKKVLNIQVPSMSRLQLHTILDLIMCMDVHFMFDSNHYFHILVHFIMLFITLYIDILNNI